MTALRREPESFTRHLADMPRTHDISSFGGPRASPKLLELLALPRGSLGDSDERERTLHLAEELSKRSSLA
jgi:hypothetical protein